MTLEEILAQSPFLKGYQEQPIQMAFYSANCCWWTSFPDDLGKLPPVKYVPGSPGKPGRIMADPGGHQLPCCPHCKSVLLQAPLINFIAYAKEQPEHYGRSQLKNFTQSHERNSRTCFTTFDQYEIFYRPFPESE